jgi:molybdenum cofactor cytidylyltransferase
MTKPLSPRPLPTVIVLAAGQGRRFTTSGGTTHKLDALLGGMPVLQHVLNTVAASELPCHVVRPEDTPHADLRGMGDSIAHGVAATADAAGWLILPGDLPLVRPDTLLRVAEQLAEHPVVVPFWQQQHGHPVGFGPTCRPALMALQGDTGAAAIVRAHRQTGQLHTLRLDDPGIVMDIDTQDDLARAETRLAAAVRSHQEQCNGRR